jgi:hypothetical protein
MGYFITLTVARLDEVEWQNYRRMSWRELERKRMWTIRDILPIFGCSD